MTKEPPSFAHKQYWEHRFRKNPRAFDWLLPASSLDIPLTAALTACKTAAPQILHIGCGTSLLSYHLRAHVENPTQIHNIDFSTRAVELGKRREKLIFGKSGTGTGATSLSSTTSSTAGSLAVTGANKDNENATSATNEEEPEKLLTELSLEEKLEENPTEVTIPVWMRWTTVDLLSQESLETTLASDLYDIVIEKSTSDAVACGDDIKIQIPYKGRKTSMSQKVDEQPQQEQEERQTNKSSTPDSITHQEADKDDHDNNSEDSNKEKYDENMRLADVYPLHMLAVNLAQYVRPGGLWIALSYSAARFPFFQDDWPPTGEDEDSNGIDILAEGFPDPAKLWTLESRVGVTTESEAKSIVVHRPSIMHWIYVLKRTDVPLL